jgi:large subunit ribosomal protein L19
MSDTLPVIKAIENRQIKAHPEFRVGDTVRVFVKIKEGDKERVQAFEGVVIKRTRNGVRGTFTVRKISYGVGVERVFPFNSPMLDKIDVASHGAVRRARLFYLRDLQGKKARIREKKDVEQVAPAAAAPTEAPKA